MNSQLWMMAGLLAIVLVGKVQAAEPRYPFLETRVKACAAFKDGTVFVVREGKVKAGADGVVLTSPIIDAALGTVGASCTTEGVRIRLLTATAPLPASRQVSFSEALGNARGREVRVRRLHNGREIRGHLLGMKAPKPIAGAIGLGEVSDASDLDYVLTIRETDGTLSMVALEDLAEVEFLDAEARDQDPEQTGQRLRIQLEGARNGQEVTISYFYLWKGIRWLPSYVGERQRKEVRLRMRAEVENDLLDLEGTELCLVVGVPSFAYLGHSSPLMAQKTPAAQQALEQLKESVAKRVPSLDMLRNSQVSFTNVAVATDIRATPADFEAAPPSSLERVANITGSGAGNLYLFKAGKIDLKRGERTLIEVADMKLACRDLVEWDVADGRVGTAAHAVAPTDRAANPLQQNWLLTAGEVPLTTGPLLVMQDGLALNQGTIYYTAPGATGQVGVGQAINVGGDASERVLARVEGSKEVKDHQVVANNGQTVWIMREIRWIDETRELTFTLHNRGALPAQGILRRVIRGRPLTTEGEGGAGGVVDKAVAIVGRLTGAADGMEAVELGGSTDTEDATFRLSWQGELESSRERTIKVKYIARIFTQK